MSEKSDHATEVSRRDSIESAGDYSRFFLRWSHSEKGCPRGRTAPTPLITAQFQIDPRPARGRRHTNESTPESSASAPVKGERVWNWNFCTNLTYSTTRWSPPFFAERRIFKSTACGDRNDRVFIAYYVRYILLHTKSGGSLPMRSNSLVAIIVKSG